MGEKQVLNVKLIKDILYNDIRKCNDINKQRRDLFVEIDSLEEIIRLIENKEYKKLYESYMNFEVILKKYTNINKNDLRNIYFYLFYINNSNLVEKSLFHDQKISDIELMMQSFLRQVKNVRNIKKNELDELKYETSREKIDEYRNILSLFNNSKIIGSKELETITKLLLDKGYDEKEVIILLEKVKLHNVFCKLSENHGKFDKQEGYKVIDIITSGFEAIEVPYMPEGEKKKSGSIILSCKTVLDSGDFENAMLLLPELLEDNTFTAGFTKEEYEYIMLSLLNDYQDSIYKSYKDLTELVNYKDVELRRLIVDDYYKNLGIYLFVRKIYDTTMKKYNMQEKMMQENDAPDVNDVYYLVRNNDENSTFLENDLKDLPKDLYDTVKTLLFDFRKGNLSTNDVKFLNEAYDNLWELRDDQVRVIFKRLEDNKVVIVGVFLKKSDNSMRNYDRMDARPLDRYLSYRDCEEEIFEHMDNTKHFGGRNNA